jgi:hypothetical protein
MHAPRTRPGRDQSDLDRYLTDLRRQDKAPGTLSSYGRTLRAFAQWFPEHTGEPFSAAAVTSLDIGEDRVEGDLYGFMKQLGARLWLSQAAQ